MTIIFIIKFGWNRTETVGEVAFGDFGSHATSHINKNEKKLQNWKIKYFENTIKQIFKIAIFGPWPWPLAKVPEVAHIPSFYPTGFWKFSLFSLYGQQFLRYWPIFKLPYLGMKLGHWPKFQKLHIYPLSTPGSRNWAYFRSTGSGF